MAPRLSILLSLCGAVCVAKGVVLSVCAMKPVSEGSILLFSGGGVCGVGMV